MTDLTERMRLHKPGQVTWPEPELNKWCSSCRFFNQADQTRARQAEGKGRCEMVANINNHKIKGVVFNGREAKACPKFDAGGFQ